MTPRPPTRREQVCRRHARTAALVAGFLALASAALAQTAGQVTAPSYEPPPQQSAGSVVFSGAPGLKAPEGAEKLSILIKHVTVEDGLPEMAPAQALLETRLTRGRISVAEIFSAAADLEAAYAKAGYVLARVVLPAQTLRDGGNLKLVVVDGYVEAIDTSNVPAKLRPRLEALTKPLVGRRGIKLRELERQVLLAGDTYGIALGSALAAGAQPGGTVIVLQPAFRSVTGFVGTDNSFSEALGTWSLQGGLEFNNYLGFGESMYLRGSGSPKGGDNNLFSEHPRLRTLAAGGVVPIGTRGLTFNVEGTVSEATPDSDGARAASTYKRLSFRIYYPWQRSRTLNVSSQWSLDIVRDKEDFLTADAAIYEDRLTILRGSADLSWLPNEKTVIEAGWEIASGLDAFDARTEKDADGSLVPVSGDPEFKKLEVSARWRRQLSEQITFALQGSAQTAFGHQLPSSEQFGIATLQDLSAFDTGALAGDSGWVVRAEVSSPSQHKTEFGPLIARPYAFAATGAVILSKPIDQPKRIDASAYGIGLELTRIGDPRFSSATVRAEYSKGVADDGAKDGNRFTLVASYRF